VLQKGRTKLEFADHTICEWEFPTIRAVGILKGDRIVRVEGSLTVTDLTNQLNATVKVSPKSSKKKGIEHPRATTVWGGVSRARQKNLIAKITGDYCDTIYLDGAAAWTIGGCFAQRANIKVENEDLLPSDARFRIDRAALIQGDTIRAEEAKCLLEALQRSDSKVRKF
jgi:hypothetical protein